MTLRRAGKPYKVMIEMYLLTRLDAIIGLFSFAAIASGVILASYATIRGSKYDASSEVEIIMDWIHKKLSLLLSILIISVIAGTFIPSTSEAYKILGIGGTIDYLKDNDTAKRIPDKVINAIDKFVDGLDDKKD